ncbi:MAG: DedA family protein [Pygmaiobacter sp.]
MMQTVFHIIEAYGAVGVFGLIFIENIFPPIPSEVLLTFSGFMTTQTQLGLCAVIFAASAGSIAGALVLYGAGTLLDEERLCRFARGGGRHFGLREQDIRRTLARYAAGQEKTVFFCRMVPILRSLISVPAGMAHMPLVRFVLLTGAGSLCWNTLLCCAGALLGDAWMLLVRYTGFYTSLVVLALCGAGLWMMVKRLLTRKKR